MSCAGGRLLSNGFCFWQPAIANTAQATAIELTLYKAQSRGPLPLILYRFDIIIGV
jgi:hypothetical protein